MIQAGSSEEDTRNARTVVTISQLPKKQAAARMRIHNRSIFDTTHLHSDLKHRSLRSGAITLTSQSLALAIQLGSVMILARILTPRDYGIIEMVVAITGLAGVLSNLGLSAATVQRASINHEQVSTLFWINAGVGAGIMAVVAALAPAVAWFYQTPELLWVMLVLSTTFLISGLGVQHRALLTRQMRFGSIATIDVLTLLLGAGVAISAARQGLGHWALVLNSVTVAFAGVIGSWFAAWWVPDLFHRSLDVSSMIRFGSDVAGFNLVNYFARNFDNVLIGRYCGGTSLGLYSKAYQLLMMPIANLRDPILSVAMPVLSQLQHKPEQYRRYYTQLVAILAFVSMPAVAFLFVCSDPIIRLLLGQQWMGASQLFTILAVAAFIQPVSTTSGLVLLSTGRSKRYFRVGSGSAIVFVASFLVGLPWGPKGVAIAYVIATYLLLYPTMVYAFRDTPISPVHVLLASYKPMTAAVVSGLACSNLLPLVDGLADLWALTIVLLAGLFVYILVFVGFLGGWSDVCEYRSYLRHLVCHSE